MKQLVGSDDRPTINVRTDACKSRMTQFRTMLRRQQPAPNTYQESLRKVDLEDPLCGARPREAVYCRQNHGIPLKNRFAT